MHEDAVLTERGKAIRLHVAMDLKRRSGRKEIVLPNAKSTPNDSLLAAVSRAVTWQGWLDQGKFESARAIARHYDVHFTNVARTLRLAGLAPDIVEAILNGNEPEGLSLGKLKGELPLLWEEQRKMLEHIC